MVVRIQYQELRANSSRLLPVDWHLLLLLLLLSKARFARPFRHLRCPAKVGRPLARLLGRLPVRLLACLFFVVLVFVISPARRPFARVANFVVAAVGQNERIVGLGLGRRYRSGILLLLKLSSRWLRLISIAQLARARAQLAQQTRIVSVCLPIGPC